MDCPIGCVSQNECSDNTSILVTAIFLAFIGFCGGQMCYIVSLSRKLNSLTQGDEIHEERTLVETPPPYQRIENM